MTNEELKIKKAEIRKQLDEKGIPYVPQWGVERLEALLNNPKPQNIQNPENTEEKNVNSVSQGFDNRVLSNRKSKYSGLVYVKVERDGHTEIYEKKHGKYVRTYSQREHGDDYKKLADRFIDTRKNLLK